MKRLAGSISILLCAVAFPAAGYAASAPAELRALTGTVTYVGDSVLTVETGGRTLGVINAMTRTANALTAHAYPYVYGGGHAEAGVASIGIRGPGYNGRRTGYDCSGSVAAVLAGAGLWPAGSSVPGDAGVIAALLQRKLIARGPGTAPSEVTLYDDPGVHIFMNINGRFFGTSDGGGGNAKGGPAWLYDGAPDSHSSIYRRYHVLASVLGTRTTYGQSFTFQTDGAPGLIAGAQVGDKVRISYAQTRVGSMTATAVEYLNTLTASGTVTALALDGTSMVIQAAGGQSLAFSTPAVPDLVAGLRVGDGVQVTYSKEASGQLIARVVQTTTSSGVT